MLDRIVEAEKALLGSILLDNTTMDLVASSLSPDDFSDYVNSQIYDACLKVSHSGMDIDMATIMYSVKDNPLYEESLVQRIIELPSCVASANNIMQYFKIIKNDSMRRKLSRFAKNILSATEQPVVNSVELATNMANELSDISDDIIQSPFCDLKEAMRGACAQLEEAYKNGGKIKGIRTGYRDLDSFLCCLRPGSLTIIAARPAMGKTALGLNILTNVAIKQNIPSVLFSLEMTQAELAMRIISTESQIAGNTIRSGTLDNNDWDRVLTAVEKNAGAPLFIDDTSGLSISLLRERVKQLMRRIKIEFIVVDYLQLLTSSSKRASNREQEIADIARGLKNLAKESDAPVLALAQLNRAVEGRATKRPMLSDLRESGSIEQDADNVLFIHRPGYYDAQEPQDLAEIIISKQRGGPTGIVNLHWCAELTRFSTSENPY